MKMILSDVESPLGAMLLATDEQCRVRALEFAERRSRLYRNLREQYGEYQLSEGTAPTAVANALQRYFAGELAALDSIEVATAGTEQQERAWAALRRIPASQTHNLRSARQVGRHQRLACGSGHGCGRGGEPHRHHRAVPPCARRERGPQRLRVGAAPQTMVARA
jgi:O6-methylguanine-DNA--protein-cysteine methyltransferase